MLYLKALGNTLFEFISLLAIGYLVLQGLRNSRDDGKTLVRKLVLTGIMLVFTFAAAQALGVREYVAGDESGRIFAVFPVVAVFLAIALSWIWTPDIGSFLISPLTNMLDGGSEAPELKPLYSIAQALRAKGKYPEAIAEIERQLEIFPGDFQGRLLLAEIDFIDLKDVAAGDKIIEDICGDPSLTPQNVVAALNAQADWHLKHARDHHAARRDLQRIIQTFPGTEAALGASQRLSHLSADQVPWSIQERQNIRLREGVKDLGLRTDTPNIVPVVASPETQAGELVRQLEAHPLDSEAREQLATIYAEHYGRIDMAVDQLEQLIAQPEVNSRKVAQWLNMVADFQSRRGNDLEAAKQTLQRIVEGLAGTHHADLAKNRIELLRLEGREKDKSQAVRLGSYEQDIGLKYGPPKRY